MSLVRSKLGAALAAILMAFVAVLPVFGTGASFYECVNSPQGCGTKFVPGESDNCPRKSSTCGSNSCMACYDARTIDSMNFCVPVLSSPQGCPNIGALQDCGVKHKFTCAPQPPLVPEGYNCACPTGDEVFQVTTTQCRHRKC